MLAARETAEAAAAAKREAANAAAAANAVIGRIWVGKRGGGMMSRRWQSPRRARLGMPPARRWSLCRGRVAARSVSIVRAARRATRACVLAGPRAATGRFIC